MPFIRDFIKQTLVAALVERYGRALATEGCDVGAARGAVEQEFKDQQREERKELSDFLDSMTEAPGSPRSYGRSTFAVRVPARG
jgi:hypothetical protein